jgi:hypothetical protein
MRARYAPASGQERYVAEDGRPQRARVCRICVRLMVWHERARSRLPTCA